MARPLPLLLATLMCGCSLMIPPAYDDADVSTDADGDAGGDADAATDADGDAPVDVPHDHEDDFACPPDSTRCNGDRYETCPTDGSGWDLSQDCTLTGQICLEDVGCVDDTPCARAAADHSHAGCEFWAVPLPVDALPGAATWELGFILSNMSDAETVDYTVFHGADTVETNHIGASSSAHVGVPLMGSGLASDSWGSDLETGGAYYIVTTGPVTAVQLNPREFERSGEFAEHQSATLLLPEPLLRTSYRVLALPPLSTAHDGTTYTATKRASYVTIVGTSDTTIVNVTAGATIAAGGGITETPAGGAINTTLGQGDVLHLAAAVPENCQSGRPGFQDLGGGDYVCSDPALDLSGTIIDTSQPVAVFVGAVAVNVPYDTGASDHVAEQVPPYETLGRNFVTAPMGADDEPDIQSMIRILAAQGPTNVTLDPAQGTTSVEMIDEGEVLEFMVETPVHIQASHPVLAAQFLVGKEFGGTRDIGDPAMTFLVPLEQWTDAYRFEVTTEYGDGLEFSEARVMIARGPGTTVTYDMAEIGATEWDGVGVGGTYQVTQRTIDSGIHFVEATGADVSVVVWGLGPYTGIAHPAGMDLASLL
jgi:hypothetical protein